MGIYDGLKDAAKVLQEAGKIEQYKQILEALEKLLDQQKRISDLETDNKDLKDKLEIKENLTHDPNDNSYYLEKAGKKDGPFCTRCWDADRKLIRLHISRVSSRASCPNCDTAARHGHAVIVR